jgi:hypothetical protein
MAMKAGGAVYVIRCTTGEVIPPLSQELHRRNLGNLLWNRSVCELDQLYRVTAVF